MSRWLVWLPMAGAAASPFAPEPPPPDAYATTPAETAWQAKRLPAAPTAPTLLSPDLLAG